MKHAPQAPRALRGMTLVELLVAVAIGMLILTAMAILFANNSRSRSETERASQKIENGRFALEMLGSELEHAGYFSVFDPRQVPLPTTTPPACATAAADLKAALPVHVQGFDGGSGGLPCISGVRPGTDVLVVRRIASCAAGEGSCPALPAGAVGFQPSSCNDPLRPELASGIVANAYKLSAASADFTLTRRDCTTAAPVYRYLVRIYYVAASDREGDGIPTLKRAELDGDGFTTATLVQGVDDFQVEYGMDSNGDGSPDVYSASPQAYQACGPTTTPTCVQHWASVVTVRLFVLARNIDATPGYTDAKTYVLGRVADATLGSGVEHGVGPFNDGFKRSVFHETVRLQNVSGRRLSP